MAAAKAGDRARRRGSAGRGGDTVEKAAGAGGDVTMIDLDRWGAFFERFWEQPAEGGSADQPDGGRKPAKGTRMVGTKPGR
jgi:hypothetical protein